jgi:hypothetical protein
MQVDGRFFIWYTSGSEWKIINNKPEIFTIAKVSNNCAYAVGLPIRGSVALALMTRTPMASPGIVGAQQSALQVPNLDASLKDATSTMEPMTAGRAA